MNEAFDQGSGLSAQLFERQMAPLAKILGPAHEIVYIDGPNEGGKALAVPDFVKGPFYNWHESLSSPAVKKAHDFIYEVIEDEGPFDGVLGLSQGASLAMSILLHHEIHHPDKPPPFKFGVFICCVVVSSPDQNFNAKYITKYSKLYNEDKKEPSTKAKRNDAKEPPSSDEDLADSEVTGEELYLSQNGKKISPEKRKSAPRHRSMLLLRGQRQALVNELVELVQEVTAMDPTPKKYEDKWKTADADDFPRLFHPLTVKQRVQIPTVHVQGKQDPLMRHGALAAKLCDKKQSKVIAFEGGHAGPSTFADHRAVATAIEWAMQNIMYI
ncbi:hypothetical protein PWT90_07547 [Aphanocladium album]|nr:hypothetical protein PWT90_07547 [Aphanocladium album]